VCWGGLWAQRRGCAKSLALRASRNSKKTSADPQVPQVNPASAITFVPFRLDLRAGRLLHGSEPVPLRPKTWSVLQYLAERPGVLVSKNDLLDAVWTDLAVTESVLSKSIGELRVALGDSFKSPRLIETVSRRGFRFIAPINQPPVTSDQLSVTSDQRSLPASPLLTDDWSLITSPFVGRTKEMQRLATLFAKASAGERQVVFITGAAGIGKTALVEAFLAQLSAARSPNSVTPNTPTPCLVVRGACVEQHGPREPYMPVIEALERMARRPDADRSRALLRRVAPTWLAQMPWLVGADERALRQSLQGVRPERMLREFAAFIEALTTDVTLVLVLEDLHWSDASSVDLLSVLGERRESARLLVIGTYRPAEVIVGDHPLARAARALQVHRRCAELALHDLTEDGVRSYLQARFRGSDFPPALARLIHAHTDGNPLFMVAVVDHMLSRGYILDTAPGWALSAPPEKIDLGIPDDVRLMIENQHSGLSPADRALLEAASVAGNDFTALVVAAGLGGEVGDAEMRCEAFVRARRFLRIAGHVEWPDRSVARRYAFTHELYRQVVYAAIPEGHCMRLHQRIGQALEAAYGARQMDIAPQLAIHFERSHDDARALHYLEAAAAHARLRFASREAIGYLETALALVALLPDGDERRRRELELRLSLGAALSDIHGFASERVRDNYERAAELCAVVGNTAQLFGTLYARWYLHLIRAERKAATALAAELNKLARRLQAVEYRVLADSVLMRTALYEGRFADAVHLVQRRLSRQRHWRPTATTAAYGPDPLIVSISNSAIGLWFLGYPERAQTTARAAVTRAREYSHPFTLSAVLMHAALSVLLCRNTAEGTALAEQAVSLSAEHGFAFWNAFASVLRGWAFIQRGHVREGCADVERALDAMQTTGTRLFSAFAYAFLAEGRLRAGALADGLAAADAGLAVAQATIDRAYEPELWRLKGELLLRQVDSRQSKVQSSRGARDRPLNSRLPTVDFSEAERCLQRALKLARAAQAKSLELRAATSLARAWQGRGRSTEARKVLGGICKWFGAQSGSPDLVEARALLAELKNPKFEIRHSKQIRSSKSE
jgi:predicted ATPase/DNA-binding winged helix-turn-helix (wHTH) protein